MMGQPSINWLCAQIHSLLLSGSAASRQKVHTVKPLRNLRSLHTLQELAVMKLFFSGFLGILACLEITEQANW